VIDPDLQTLVERYEAVAPDALRVILAYDGDEKEVVYVRDDVREFYSEEEFEQKIQQLVVEGISDPPNQIGLRRYGRIDVVIRRFDDAIVLHYPLDEFAGVAVTLDRIELPPIGDLADVGTDHLSAAADQ
jgi:hypothetical protein